MHKLDPAIQSFEELKTAIHLLLCQSENLLAEQFVTRHQCLVTRGTLTAVEFSLRGPRNIRLTAIWAVEPNLVYFYNTRGERESKARLHKRISLDALAEPSAA